MNLYELNVFLCSDLLLTAKITSSRLSQQQTRWRSDWLNEQKAFSPKFNWLCHLLTQEVLPKATWWCRVFAPTVIRSQGPWWKHSLSVDFITLNLCIHCLTLDIYSGGWLNRNREGNRWGLLPVTCDVKRSCVNTRIVADGNLDLLSNRALTMSHVRAMVYLVLALPWMGGPHGINREMLVHHVLSDHTKSEASKDATAEVTEGECGTVHLVN